MTKKHLYFLTIPALLALVFVAGCKGGNSEQSAQAKGRSGKVKAEVFVVSASTFANSYTSGGTLLPNEEITIMPEVSGRVTSIGFKEGATVRKGQLLVQLYDADLKAQLQRLHAQRNLQQNTEARQQELLRIGGISKQDFEATQTQIQLIDADIQSTTASLSKMRIVAPFDGTVGLRNISVGAVVSPATAVAILQQTHTLKMDFAVPEQYKDQITIGSKVRFTVDESTDTQTATITAIDPGADVATRTVKVRTVVVNTSYKLSPGRFAHVTIPLAQNNNAILIPSQAIIPTTRDKKVVVMKSGLANLVTVKTAVRTADKIEIMSGLNIGDTILTTALMQVKPGDTVKIQKVNL